MTPTFISYCWIFKWRHTQFRKKKRIKASITCRQCYLNKYSVSPKSKICHDGSKRIKIVPNCLISRGKLLSEVHIDARTTLEAWNGGNDFGICHWHFINKFSFFNEMKIYSDGSKGNKIGDEIIWLLVINCYTRSIW